MTEPVFQGALRPLLLLLLWLPASAALAVTAKPATFGMEIQAASIPMPDGVLLPLTSIPLNMTYREGRQ